jgi:MinD-like ATPase involved in chromosome partitioning or flagellar assembly
LVDSDQHSGVLSVLLGCKHPYSLHHALDNSMPLDYSQWTKYVTKSRGLDVLLSSRCFIEPLPSWSDYYHLLDFVPTRYDGILVDLPEVVNDATVEIGL